MINRTLESKLLQLLEIFPIVSVTGPRQSGKTTLVRKTFSNLPYVSLENPDDRQFAQEDPRKFLGNFPDGAVFDEVQRVPEIFSYLQGVVDEDQKKKYILSGSQNFLLAEQISQSLAGRVGILKLLPFSMAELKSAQLLGKTFDEVAYTGFYPRIFDRKIQPEDFYPNYIQTYVERDVRQLTQVSNLNTFSTFLRLCAGRAGQLLNLSELSNDIGISIGTARSWIKILESRFILFRLYPHYKNFNKRLVKMPKLYFYDTGLLSYLLGLREHAQLQIHFAKGAIFENLIIAELLKRSYHRGLAPHLYFWRDHKGKEIDLLIEQNPELLIPVEIKSGATKSMRFFEGLKYWNQLSGNAAENAYVVYGGDEDMVTAAGQLIGWRTFVDYSF